jgi:alpha/beta superfamily hydrolase
LKINGAGHFYREKHNELINQLSAMLDKNVDQ